MFSRVLKTLGILLLCSGPLFSQGQGQFGNGSSGAGNALTSQPLSQFASTTSLQLAGVISDETGTGSLVFNTSPTFITSISVTDTAANSDITATNTTAAVVGTSQGSPLLNLCGKAFHGSASVADCLTIGDLPGNGNDAAITFTIGHTGTSTGVISVAFPGPVVAGAGSQAAPGLSFAGTPNSGWYSSTGLMALSEANATFAVIRALGGYRAGSAQGFCVAGGTDPTAAGCDIGWSRLAAGYAAFGNGTAGTSAGFLKTGNTVTLSADWTCGTGGTVASCVAATIVGSTATPLTFTLPLVAATWHFDCDLVVGQATAATANQWNLLTATNGVTSTTAAYQMATAATASANGAVTDVASTTSTFQVTPSWTLGGTATKMPVHIAGTLTGTSASGTVFSLQLLAPTVGDLVTIYEGSGCSVRP